MKFTAVILLTVVFVGCSEAPPKPIEQLSSYTGVVTDTKFMQEPWVRLTFESGTILDVKCKAMLIHPDQLAVYEWDKEGYLKSTTLIVTQNERDIYEQQLAQNKLLSGRRHLQSTVAQDAVLSE